MKLFLLSRNHDLSYDEVHSQLIRAETEERARQIAAKECGDEGENEWHNENKSSCEIITSDGDERVIITDYNAG